MVRNGTKDLAGSWITITEERCNYVSFTYPYYDVGIALVYKTVNDNGVRQTGRQREWREESNEKPLSTDLRPNG